MQVNEVVVNGVTELSLVNDTVSEDNLLEGETAHDASGKQITGKVVVTPVDSELNAESENAIQNKAVVAGINNAVNGVKEYANGIISNPNLLDNPNFSINQRGQTEYTGAGYGVDRWKNVRASNGYRVTSEGIQPITSSDTTIIQQKIEGSFDRWRNKTLTLSLLRTDGQLFTCTGKVPDTEPSSTMDLIMTGASTDGRLFLQWNVNDKLLIVNLNKYQTTNPTVTYVAVKLELGSIQTLAHKDTEGHWVLNDPPPNPATELAKCQRYALVLSPYIRYGTSRVSGEDLDFFISTPTTMRIKPTVDLNNITLYFLNGSTPVAATEFTFSAQNISDNGFTIRATKASHGLNWAFIEFVDKTKPVIISADL